jgi:drug/metabolite transporter (DMT)-like permease
MTAILLALGSSVGYGVSDFLASRVTKRVAPVLLVLYSQALQSVVLLVVVMAVSQPYSGAGLAWGTAAGAVGAAGLVAYYQALAVGQTAIVAPLASTGAVLPLLVDLARGERPGPVALGGLLLVLGGIVVTSLAPVVTALLAHVLIAERPSAPQAAGAALAVLGTLVVSAAQAAA